MGTHHPLPENNWSPAAAWLRQRLGPRKGKQKLNSFETARGGRMQFSPSVLCVFSQPLLFLNILLKRWIAELPGEVQYPSRHCLIRRINHLLMPLHCCSRCTSFAPCSSCMELLTHYSCWIPCGSCDHLGHSTSFWRSGPCHLFQDMHNGWIFVSSLLLKKGGLELIFVN